MNTLPDNFVLGELSDFVSIDKDKDKNWTWRVGLQFAIRNSQDEYEMYVIGENWNEKNIYDPDIEKPDKRTMFVVSNSVGFIKGNLLCQFIDAEMVFVDKKDKYHKPLSKSEQRKLIIGDGTTDF